MFGRWAELTSACAWSVALVGLEGRIVEVEADIGAGLPGVATQEADCRELASTLDCTIVSIHTDNDLSAYARKPRPGYKALLTEVKAGEIDAVIAWHTDRLHRSPAELEEYVTACESHGVKTFTVKAGNLDLTTASGVITVT